MTEFEVAVGTYSGAVFGFGVLLRGESETDLVCAPSFSIQDTTQAIRCLSVTPDGVLAAGGSDTEIYLYLLRRHRALAVLEGHVGPVRDIIQVPAGVRAQPGKETGSGRLGSGYAISTGEDSKLAVWRLKDGEMLTSLACRPHPANSLALHPNGACFTALAGSAVLLYALDTCKQIGRLSVRHGRGRRAEDATHRKAGVGGGAGEGDFPSQPSREPELSGGINRYFYHAWQAGPVMPEPEGTAPAGEEPSQLLLLSPRVLRLVELRGGSEAAAEYLLPDLGSKLTAAAFLPEREAEISKGASLAAAVHGILVGDDRGLIRVLQAVPRGHAPAGEAPFRLAVRAKFQLSQARVKAVVPAPGGVLCIILSDGELIFASLHSLTEISILKRIYVPGRPTAACVYGGRLDRETRSLLEREAPPPGSETEKPK